MIDSATNAIECLAQVLRHLNIRTPAAQVDPVHRASLQGLKLADPSFERPGRVDIVLRDGLYTQLMIGGVRRGPLGNTIAQRTVLGWVIVGSASPSSGRLLRNWNTLASSGLNELSISRALRRFWELEEVAPAPPLSADDEACERLFASSHRRLADGGYCVRLPLRYQPTAELIGDTLAIARQALRSVQRRMSKDALLKPAYETFLSEYESLGHMEPIPQNAVNSLSVAYYIPHHAIWQPADGKRKLRVVFDASRRSQGHKSLNQMLSAGPPLQTDLISIILRWRRHRVVFCADIKMMYRQIRIDPADADLQRIVWQRAQDSEIQHFRLMTLTYGTSCAPYLALRTLRQLAFDEGSRFPKAARCLAQDTYVDDVLTGASNVEEAQTVRDQLIALLRTGGFPLGKWVSNHPRLLDDVATSDLLRPAWHEFQTCDPVSTLGIAWDPVSDTFRFQCSRQSVDHSSTKRRILATIARLFDPGGWLSPAIILAKMLLQDLWKERLCWDDPLPSPLSTRWLSFMEDLTNITGIQMPRWLKCDNATSVHLHGFADASQTAYAAVAYLVVPRAPDRPGSSSLIMAKTKVAPLKTVSIPRLELCATVLLSRLIKHILDTFQDTALTIQAWTDSEIVLAWLRAEPSRWSTFVAHRVAEIQLALPNATWRHVPSTQNPADIASRGLMPSILKTSNLWWNGPEWMTSPSSQWPRTQCGRITDDPTVMEDARPSRRNPEIRAIHLTSIEQPSQELQTDPFDRFSSLIKLERSIAWCLRIRRLHQPTHDTHRDAPLTSRELDVAFKRCVYWAKRVAFPREIKRLELGGILHKGSPLRGLSPFFDATETLRVGGRLQESALPYPERHPVILPKRSHLSDLIIDWAHMACLHGGYSLTYAQIVKRAWIVGGRTKTRAFIRRCLRCARTNSQPLTQLMGRLARESHRCASVLAYRA